MLDEEVVTVGVRVAKEAVEVRERVVEGVRVLEVDCVCVWVEV